MLPKPETRPARPVRRDNYAVFAGEITKIIPRYENYLVTIENEAGVSANCYIRSHLVPPILMIGSKLSVAGNLKRMDDYISVATFLEKVHQSSRVIDGDAKLWVKLNMVTLYVTELNPQPPKTPVQVNSIVVKNSITSTAEQFQFRVAFYDPVRSRGATQTAGYATVVMHKKDYPKQFSSLPSIVKEGKKYTVEGVFENSEKSFSLSWALKQTERTSRAVDGDDDAHITRQTLQINCKKLVELTPRSQQEQ